MNERTPTCCISYSDDRPSSDPHALRIDQGRAQKSCNGAIYCRTALLQHEPGITDSLQRIYGKCVNSQSARVCRPREPFNCWMIISAELRVTRWNRCVLPRSRFNPVLMLEAVFVPLYRRYDKFRKHPAGARLNEVCIVCTGNTELMIQFVGRFHSGVVYFVSV